MSQLHEPPDGAIDEALLELPPEEQAELAGLAARLRERPLPSPHLRSAIRSRITTQRPVPAGSLRLAFGSIGLGLVLFAITALGLGGVGPLSA
jgi:hypothetical protein